MDCNTGADIMQPNSALIRFSKEFDIPIDSPELLPKLIKEISKLKKELQERNIL